MRYLIIIFLFVCTVSTGQDSTRKTGTLPADTLLTQSMYIDSIYADSVRKDSIRQANARYQIDTLLYAGHPVYKFTDPVHLPVSIREWQGKEAMFYSIVALLLFFAFIRNAFYRYLLDLFRSFFRTSIKQRQIKDQMLQSPLPSLLLNIFFMLCIGFFGALLLHYFQLGTSINFWWLYVYCVAGLATIYGLKFLSLKILGWIFQVTASTDAYIFIVFTTNKVIGIALLPLVIVLAFTEGNVFKGALTLSLMVVGACLLYRYFLAYSAMQKQLQINFLHFLLYLAAFEIVPLLLINKLLFRFLT